MCNFILPSNTNNLKVKSPEYPTNTFELKLLIKNEWVNNGKCDKYRNFSVNVELEGSNSQICNKTSILDKTQEISHKRLMVCYIPLIRTFYVVFDVLIIKKEVCFLYPRSLFVENLRVGRFHYTSG